MHHAVGNLDAGREAVHQDTPRHTFKNRQQALCHRSITRIHVKGRGQLAFKTPGQSRHVCKVRHTYDQAKGSEDLFAQAGIAPVGFGIGLIQVRPGHAPRLFADHDGRDTVDAVKAGLARAIGGRDAGGQHGLRRDLPQGRGSRGDQRIAFRTRHDNSNAGICAELARPHGQRRGPPGPDRATARRASPRQNEHRIDGPQLAEKRNGMGPRGAQIKKRTPPGK